MPDPREPIKVVTPRRAIGKVIDLHVRQRGGTVADLPLDQRPCVAAKPLLSRAFTLTDLTRVRHEVEAVSRRCALTDDEVVDWITAVNELLINTVRHGGGRGTVRLQLLNDRLTCEVTDHGPGFTTAHYVPRTQRPSPSATGGMGLWLVGQLTEFLQVDSGAAGTMIRIATRTRDTAG